VVFEAVCTDLESEGYEVQPFIIPAAGVGAPHRRERVWIIAIREESMVNSDNIRFEQHNTAKEEASRRRSSATFESTGDVPNTESFSSDVGGRGEHQEERDGQRKIRGEGSEDVANTQSKSSEFFSNRGSDDKIKEQSREETGQSNRSSRGQDVADTERIGQSRSRKPIGSSNTETNQIRQTSRLNDGSQGTQGWWDVEPDVGRVAHGVSGRVHRLRALGNSIIPQIAEEIGKAIINMERRKNEERH
jgi:DNA (cytosine-5)-methyltransferase 1